MVRAVCSLNSSRFIFIVLMILLFYYHSQLKSYDYGILKSSNNQLLNYIVNTRSNLKVEKFNQENGERAIPKVGNKTVLEMKYILQWTSPKRVPFVYMGQGQEGFIKRKCPYTNCFVTSNKSYLGDYSKFDVIAFAGPEVVLPFYYELPKKRSLHQKYVFASIESSDNYPVCSNRFNGYFNWTWTFVLDSQVKWGYMAIRNTEGIKIGPSIDVDWIKIEDMDPVDDDLKVQLRNKTKAAAWFVSNCYTRSKRERYVKNLGKALRRYNLTVDIYGQCGTLKCSRGNETICGELIRVNYYFYLSFENSFSKDYVTEKLLHALNNDAIPIVYGGADYKRFMPDGIYLNARELGVEALAAKMNVLIQNPDEYAEYFKWKNHYTYHRLSESTETDPYCLFCTILNDQEMVKTMTVYDNFSEWWDPQHICPKKLQLRSHRTSFLSF